MVSVRVSYEQDWFNTTLAPSRFSIRSDGIFEQLEIGAMKVGPSSFGEALVSIPEGKLDSTNDVLSFSDDIFAQLPSSTASEQYINFVSAIANDFTMSTRAKDCGHSTTDTSLIILPFALFFPAMNAKMTIPQASLNLGVMNIQKDGSISIDHVTIDAPTTTSLKMEGLKMQPKSMEITIATVSSCNIDGYFHLCAPLIGTKIIMSDASCILLHLDYLHIHPTYSGGTTNNRQHCDNSSTPKSTPKSWVWPVQFRLNKIRVDPSLTMGCAIRAKDFDGLIESPSAGTFSLHLQRDMMFQLDKGGNFVRLSIQSFKAQLSSLDGWFIQTANIFNLRLLSSSFGFTAASLPEASFDNNVISTSDATVEIESQQVTEKLVAFFQSVDIGAGESSGGIGKAFELSFRLNISAIHTKILQPSSELVLTTIDADLSCVNVQSVTFEDASGTSMSGIGLSLTFATAVNMSLHQLRHLHIPGVAKFETVSPISVVSNDWKSLSVKCGNLAVVLPASRQNTEQSSHSNSLFLPLSFSADSVGVQIGLTGFKMVTGKICLTVVPDGDVLRIESRGKLISTLVAGNTGKQIEAAVGTPDEVFSLDMKMATMQLVKLHCPCPQIGTASFGKLVASTSTLSFEPTVNTIVAASETNVFVEVPDELLNVCNFVRPLVDYFASDGSGYGVMVAHGVLMTEKPFPSRISVNDMYFDGANVIQVDRLQVIERSSKISASLSGISAKVTPFAVTEAVVETFYVEGTLHLKEPIGRFQCWYCGKPEYEELSIVFPRVAVISSRQQSVAAKASPVQTAFPELPFNISCKVDELLLFTLVDHDVPISLQNLAVAVTAPIIDPFQSKNHVERKTFLSVRFDKMKNSMLHLNQVHAQMEVPNMSGQHFEHLRFRARDGMATAGFSSVDWESIFFGVGATGQADTIIHLPFARIESLEVGLSYQGAILGSQTRIMIPKFEGSKATTSQDIVAHFKNAILRRAPAFLAKANVLGANLGDSAVSTAAIVAMGARSSIVAAPGAGVLGMVAYDGVVGAIKSGKEARGVSEHEKYKFGDVTRGSIRAIANAHRVGAGAVSSSAKEYARENSSRFGGAAGSTVGLMAGAALLGPVGLVAGAVVGAKAGANAFRSRNKQESEVTAESQEVRNQNAPIDLLDNQCAIAPPAEAPAPTISDISHGGSARLASPPQIGRESLMEQRHVQPTPDQYNRVNPLQAHQGSHVVYQNGQPVNQFQDEMLSLQTHPAAVNPQQRALQATEQRPQQGRGYRFGDFSRRMIAKGKEKDGRSTKDGYKFGDFTRGIFK